MQITDIYHTNPKEGVTEYYFQKSTMFLYPLVSDKELPFAETHIYKTYLESNYKHHKPGYLYVKTKERSYSVEMCRESFLQSDYFVEEIERNKYSIFIFDLSEKMLDYLAVLQGEYSKLSLESKVKIQKHYAHIPHVKSYITPLKFHRIYSDILRVKEDEIFKTFELCDRPNMKKEYVSIVQTKKRERKNEEVNDKTRTE